MKTNVNKYGKEKMRCVTECKQFAFSRKQTLILFSSGLTEKWYDNEMVRNYKIIYDRNKKDGTTNLLHCLIKKCMHDSGNSNEHISVVSIKFN